jgi:ubiquinone/menaquinone biosynthesis C-methylase UbiE
MPKNDVRKHFEGIAGEYDRWKEKSAYYYRLLARIYREHVPEGASVLEIGCGTGTLLHALRPSRGLGVNISPAMVEIAAAKFPSLSLCRGSAGSDTTSGNTLHERIEMTA